MLENFIFMSLNIKLMSVKSTRVEILELEKIDMVRSMNKSKCT